MTTALSAIPRFITISETLFTWRRQIWRPDPAGGGVRQLSTYTCGKCFADIESDTATTTATLTTHLSVCTRTETTEAI